MQAFSYVAPKTVGEAAAILAKEGDNAKVLSGGTDIIVQLREGRRQAGVVVDIKGIAELNQLTYDAIKGALIGAAVPCHRINADPAISKAYPGLIDSTTLIGGTAIQGRATLGGNVCTASPAGDSIPTLIALGAVCVVMSKSVTRHIPVEKFCVGPGKNALLPGEMLIGFQIPAPKARQRRGLSALYPAQRDGHCGHQRRRRRATGRQQVQLCQRAYRHRRGRPNADLCGRSWRGPGRTAGQCGLDRTGG